MSGIGADDLAELRHSLRPGRAEMFVASAGETTIAEANAFVDVAGTWKLTPESAHHWAMSTNGQLKYTFSESRFVLLFASVSMTAGASNVVTKWRFAVNGSSSASSEVQRKVGTGSDVGALALVGSAILSAGDYVTLQVANATSSANVTADAADVVVMSFPT